MRNSILFCTLCTLLFISQPTFSQTYNLSWKQDLPIMTGAFGLALGSSLSIRNVEGLSVNEISQLDRQDVNAVDRFATNWWSPSADHASDFGLYIAAAAPFITAISPKVRAEAAPIAVMLFEGGFATLGLTNLTKQTVLRPRPFVYNSLPDFAEKRDPDARFAFFSGHTSLTTYGAFFTAKVLHDLYPNEKWTRFSWAGAALLSGTTGFLRIRAGRHYLTDVLVGLGVGAGIGVLVPELHKSKETALSIYPANKGLGMVLTF